MQGNARIIEKLNVLLADELTAINMYMVQSEMCDNWGYERLHQAIERRAKEEMRHAEKLIARILFLEGLPEVGRINVMKIGSNVEAMHRSDLEAETAAASMYNEGVRLAVELADNGTRDLLESILKDEEAHIDWLEAQRDQIEQMGPENYLANQV